MSNISQEPSSRNSIVVSPAPISEPIIFNSWQDGYRTQKSWKYDFGRRIKRGEKPSFVDFDGNHVPVFHISQTALPKRHPSELQAATTEYLRRFWLHSRHDQYLWCDDGVSTIVCRKQQERGRIVPWLNEKAMLDHLRGDNVYGIFGEDSYRGKPAATYWIAVDLDLHLAAGGNLDLFWTQVNAILPYVWTRDRCQIVLSPTKIGGLHVYLFFNSPIPLDQARSTMRTILGNIHADHPAIEAQVDEWNGWLKVAYPDKGWFIRQINDLEIYPDQKHGFRPIGTRGKVVLADREIGMVKWGEYRRGRRKGQPKFGFDVIAWWRSLQVEDRMPLGQVLDYIRVRLPNRSEQLPVQAIPLQSPPPQAKPTPAEAPVILPSAGACTVSPAAKRCSSNGLGSLHRQTRQKLTGYWLGTFNPPGCLEQIFIITARLLAKEGLPQDAAATTIKRYVREIPVEARHCSGRLKAENWRRLDQDIDSAIRNAYQGNGRQADVDKSNQELEITIRTWKKFGFRLSDKTTWGTTVSSQSEIRPIPTSLWTDQDRKDIELWLMPALKIKEPTLAVNVATAIVELTLIKEREESGWGYSYLRKWLPDRFGIPCGKHDKQQAILQALRELKIIHQRVASNMGRATGWTLGKRAKARMAGDHTDDWKQTELSAETLQRQEQAKALLEGTNYQMQPRGRGEEREIGLLLASPLLASQPFPMKPTTNMDERRKHWQDRTAI